VAAEAQVPLSATTYYFKDIDDLLTDTFAQYVERSAAYMGKLWVNNEGLLRDMIASGDGSPQARSKLADDIARLMTDYVHRQLVNRREHLMAEQAFRQEALLNPRLAELVRSHQQILLQGSCQLFQVLGSREPHQDAKVLTAIIGRMEYQGLLNVDEPAAEEEMLGILTRYMHLVLASV
jgi:DNA-binding transcriptional regulator YbjK